MSGFREKFKECNSCSRCSSKFTQSLIFVQKHRSSNWLISTKPQLSSYLKQQLELYYLCSILSLIFLNCNSIANSNRVVCQLFLKLMLIGKYYNSNQVYTRLCKQRWKRCAIPCKLSDGLQPAVKASCHTSGTLTVAKIVGTVIFWMFLSFSFWRFSWDSQGRCTRIMSTLTVN